MVRFSLNIHTLSKYQVILISVNARSLLGKYIDLLLGQIFVEIRDTELKQHLSSFSLFSHRVVFSTNVNESRLYSVSQNAMCRM